LHIKALWKASFPDAFCANVYAAKGSKTFWHYNIGYYTKWENSNICNYSEYCKNEKLGFFIYLKAPDFSFL